MKVDIPPHILHRKPHLALAYITLVCKVGEGWINLYDWADAARRPYATMIWYAGQLLELGDVVKFQGGGRIPGPRSGHNYVYFRAARDTDTGLVAPTAGEWAAMFPSGTPPYPLTAQLLQPGPGSMDLVRRHGR